MLLSGARCHHAGDARVVAAYVEVPHILRRRCLLHQPRTGQGVLVSRDATPCRHAKPCRGHIGCSFQVADLVITVYCFGSLVSYLLVISGTRARAHAHTVTHARTHASSLARSPVHTCACAHVHMRFQARSTSCPPSWSPLARTHACTHARQA